MAKQAPKIDPQSSQPNDNPPDPRDNLPMAMYQLGVSGALTSMGAQDPPNVPIPAGLGGMMAQVQRPTGAQLSRGVIKELYNGSDTEERPGGNFALHFMFNPTDINLSYNFDMQTTPGYSRTADQQGNALANNRSISLDLVFDRTYEVWWGHGPNGEYDNTPYKYGAMWDGRAAERLVGMYNAYDSFTDSAQPPRQYPVRMYLGGDGAFAFRGMIQDLAVHYTRFSKDMTAIRCEINITLLEVMKAQTSGTTGDTSGSSQTDPATSVTPTTTNKGPS